MIVEDVFMDMETFIGRIKDRFKGEIRQDEPLSRHTSLKIGGKAMLMLIPEDIDSLRVIIEKARDLDIKVLILGGGTNLLIDDRGVDGLVVSTKRLDMIEYLESKGRDDVILRAGAGLQLGGLISHCMRNGLSGMESLAGIPGTVGGAVFMNAGSFGTEIKDVVIGVEIMDREGSIRRLSRSEIGFSYRSSGLPEGSIIISAEFRLRRDKPESVSKRVRETIRKKSLSQPLNYPSAGCVFKNPPSDSAGRLIDSAGCKGMRCGGIEVSSVHANFFINRGGGTFDDFINLMEEVKERVYKASGIKLEPEICILRREG